MDKRQAKQMLKLLTEIRDLLKVQDPNKQMRDHLARQRPSDTPTGLKPDSRLAEGIDGMG